MAYKFTENIPDAEALFVRVARGKYKLSENQ
jgi:hypothetical protein